MEPPSLSNSVPSNSKKRLISGTMDSDVVEIPPPMTRTLKMLKNKEVTMHDVIEIDKDDDCSDVIFIDERGDKNNKGKAVKTVSNGNHDHQTEEAIANNLFGTSIAEALGLNGVESSKSSARSSHNFINLDDHSSDLSNDDDDYIDLCSEEFMDVDEYSMLQAHFDNVDIPSGIEAPIPWFSDPLQTKKPVTGSSSVHTRSQTESDAVGPHGIKSSSSLRLSETGHFSKMSIPMSNSSLHIHVDGASHSPGMLPHSAQYKNKSASFQHKGSAPNLSLGVESSKSTWLKPFQRKKKPVSSSSSNYNSISQLDAMKLPSGVEPSYWGQNVSDTVKKQGAANNLYASSLLLHTDTLNYAPGVISQPRLSPFVNHTAHSSFFQPLNSAYHPQDSDMSWGVDYVHAQRDAATVGSSTNNVQTFSSMDKDEILQRFRLFKQFDTVEDHSDHHYAGKGSSTKHPSKNWAKRIQEEWRILEKDLPDTIFVRVYESRMDLLRAVIVGAEGTPYHDGLFFFDVFFPSGYPNVPPQVHYHSGGLRINPNLYNCGKVCLSLLNTWSGNKNEKWLPGVSTMLQVLVSIQGLILNPKPFFNEPGYARMSGSPNGEIQSQQYNENTFILSLKTMVYIIRRPPKHFEELVMGHFYNRSRDILVACRAYMDGAQVGCLVKGGVQDVDEGDKSCSKTFQNSLPSVVQMLIKEFSQIGAPKDCEGDKVSTPTVNGNEHTNNLSQVAT
ncbi:probable ubiquitin-conjugating enzyme E2 26 isoform X1 [Ziziphus jujuba]|uniref:Probable ubiquitin-conjugating enzyme E2 26 isoform X1 n=2 Tax=Ziziphus jujuba TaxID=326968 RepID=A0ABM3I6D2_ZIZJJ|nr:probable ubiquitin-conjugating enzyme E2 26 isoform X1 [Ziziphus jujuba]